MPSSILVVAPVKDIAAIETLVALPSIQQSVSEQGLPSLRVEALETALNGQLTRFEHIRAKELAAFSTHPQSHILIGTKLLEHIPEAQEYALLHELRHAFQWLVDESWATYREKRRSLLTNYFLERERQRANYFLGGPLELDANVYALGRQPIGGGELLARRAGKVTAEIHGFRAPIADTLQVSMDLLPNVWEWGQLLPKRILPPEKNEFILKQWRIINSFVLERTRLNGRKQGEHELHLAYQIYLQTTDPNSFLAAAGQLLLKIYQLR